MRKLNIIYLIVFNVLLLFIFITAIFWGGFAKTGSGITIPNNGLIIPFLVFIAFSIIQIVALKSYKLKTALAVCIVKFILFQWALYIICGYAFSDSFIQANMVGSFYDNITYTVTVVAFIVVGLLSFLFDIISYCLSKDQNYLNF